MENEFVRSILREASPGTHFAMDERSNETAPNLLTEITGNFDARRVDVPVDYVRRTVWYGRRTPATTDDMLSMLEFRLRGQVVCQLPQFIGTVSRPYIRFNFVSNTIAFSEPFCPETLFWQTPESHIPVKLWPVKLFIACDEVVEKIIRMPVSVGIPYNSILAVASGLMESVC